MTGALAVVEADGGSRPLQQGLGDEEAQAEAGGFAIRCWTSRRRRTRRDVGLAQRIHDVGRHPRAIVCDGDCDQLGRPGGGDLDAGAGEVDRVLDEVAQTVDDAGTPFADGLRGRCAVDAGLGVSRDHQLGAEPAIGACSLIDQLRDAHVRMQQVWLARRAGELF